MKLETRAHKGIEVRAAPEGSEFIGVLEGYAAVFDSNSLEFENRGRTFVEKINPGAFTRSLEERKDVVALWNHETNQPVARTPNTLSVSEDERGLKVEMSLANTTTNRDLKANVEAGNVDAMSFGFNIVDDSWDKTGEQDTRTLNDVELHEVSAVVWPAYPDTSIAVRSHEKFIEETREEEPEPDPEPETEETREEDSNVTATHLSIWKARLGIK